jgi:hypothetical protein
MMCNRCGEWSTRREQICCPTCDALLQDRNIG